MPCCVFCRQADLRSLNPLAAVSMQEVLTPIVALMLLLAVFIAVNITMMVLKMSDPGKVIKADEHVEPEVMGKMSDLNKAWIRKHGFEFIGSYRFKAANRRTFDDRFNQPLE